VLSMTLASVSCPDYRRCAAVGYYFAHGASHSLAAFWNGAGWTLQAPPTPSGATGADLRASSCTMTACMGVGEYTDAAGNSLALAEEYLGGRWRVKAVPPPTGAATGQLTGVSCAGLSCVAVGNYDTTHYRQRILVELWNGSSWQPQHVELPAGAGAGELNGVSCMSASTCIAVGQYLDDHGIELSLIETRNGAGWTMQPSPNPDGVVASPLNAVSCDSAVQCVAVGYAYGLGPSGLPNPPTAYAQAWDGQAWSLDPVAQPPGTNSSLLAGVSCLGGTCLAGGYRFASSGRQVTFAVGGP
jgi:hypothetical protein